jgi:diguanylate cyclase (GGDEF)-like protein
MQHVKLADMSELKRDEATLTDVPEEPTAFEADCGAKLAILLVEDDPIVAFDIRESLNKLGYCVVGVAIEGLEAVAMAQSLRPSLVLMDVGLPGSMDGIQAAAAIQEHAQIPVIFLTGFLDDDTLNRAVRHAGPSGYLGKPFKEVELRCAIEVAVHKHRAEIASREREEALRRNAEILHSLSLVDELTGLRNRRGFFTLAQQEMKVARREHIHLALFFLDLNGLKQINDDIGHSAGDRALREAAAILRRTFRESDILARLGGDEFVALTRLSDEESIHPLRQRLRDQLAEFNAASDCPFVLDMSIGAVLVDLNSGDDIEALLALADAAMYEEKRAFKNSRMQAYPTRSS